MELGSEFNLSLSDLQSTDANVFNYLSDASGAYYCDSGRSAIKAVSQRFSRITTVSSETEPS